MSNGEQMAAKLAGASAPANSQQPQGKNAIAALIGAFGTAVAAGISGYSTWRANQANRDLMHEQNQWNLDQWFRENLYNLPSSQIARLKAAGLNPSLIYGEGGIMNEAANSVPAADAPTMRPELTIDPLTASQVQLNEAQAQSIKDANERENEKQPITLLQMSQDLEQCRAKTDEILQYIKNLKFDEQIKSIDYLKSSLDYQFSSTTFNDAVEQFKTTLSNLKKVGRKADFDYNRALQYLAYEVIGWDLSNSRQRALLNIDRQTYRQTEELFEDVKRKAFWDSQNSYMDWSLKGKQEGIMRADMSLKQLAFWIDARNNPHAFEAYESFTGFKGSQHIWSDPFSQFMSDVSDTWRHGINVPLSIGK